MFLVEMFLCCLLLIACSKPLPLPFLSKGATVLAFGDSLTFGTGAKEEASYPAVLARLSQLNIVNAGVPGEITEQGLLRLEQLLEAQQPELLLLCHGGNDFLRKLNREKTINHLKAMIQLAKQRSIPVLLIAVPKLGLLLASDPLYEEIAKEEKLVLENDIIATVLSNTAMKSDTVHPNAKGYALIAESIYHLLQKHGALD